MRDFRTLVLVLAAGLGGCADDKDEGGGKGGDDTGGSATGPELEGDDAGECSDGADNDLDNLFDCADPDCASSPDCEDGEDVNYEPTQPVVAISPEEPGEDDDLSCDIVNESEDAEGDEITYAFEWTVDDAASGISSQVVQARFTEGDETWSCTVTPSDGVDEGLSASDSVWVERSNTPPTSPTVSISPEEPSPDDDLVCNIDEESTDAEDDPISYTYAWALDGTDIGYSLSTVRASVTEEGEEWTCTVTPTDGREDGEPGSATVEIPTCTGYGMEFNGSDAYVSATASSDFAWGSAFTIEAWVYWAGETGNDSQVLVDHGASPEYSFTLAIAGQTTSSHALCSGVDAGEVLFMVAGSSASSKTCLKSGTLVAEEGWTHLAATFDSGDMNVYIDGVQTVWAPTGSSANDASDQDLYVGGRPDETVPFNGIIDELHVSSVARYTTDFTPVEETVSDSDSVLLWTFDDGSGSTVTDDAGNGHDGTIVNATFSSDSSCDAVARRGP